LYTSGSGNQLVCSVSLSTITRRINQPSIATMYDNKFNSLIYILTMKETK
jgi:hypothetical protein